MLKSELTLKAKRNKKKKIKFLKITLFTLLSTFILGVFFLFLIFVLTSSYLKSERFIELIESKVGNKLNINGKFDNFQWSGSSFSSNSFKGVGNSLSILSKVKANGIRADINLGAIKNKTWEVSSVNLNQLNFLSDQSKKKDDKHLNEDDSSMHKNEKVSWFREMFFPDKLFIKLFNIGNINFDLNHSAINVLGRGLSLSAEQLHPNDPYNVRLFNGSIWLEDYPKLDLINGNIRVLGERTIIDSVNFNVFDSSNVRIFGEIDSSKKIPANIECKISEMPTNKVLPEDWVKKLKGQMNVDISLVGGLSYSEIEGRAELIDGRIEALPILDRIDSFLGTSKFRSLALNELKIDFVIDNSDTIDIKQFYSLTTGTICVTGSLKFNNRKISSGSYMVGITPETLKWLSLSKRKVLDSVFSFDRRNAFKAVFNTSINSNEHQIPPDGFKWAICEINPVSLDPYTSDIRKQIIDSGGLALWGELIGLSDIGFKALDLLAESSKKQGVQLSELLADENFIIDNKTLKNIASKLNVSSQMDEILTQLKDEIIEIPKGIFQNGSSLIEKFLFGN